MGRKEKFLRIRVTPGEKELIRRASGDSGQTMSAWIIDSAGKAVKTGGEFTLHLEFTEKGRGMVPEALGHIARNISATGILCQTVIVDGMIRGESFVK